MVPFDVATGGQVKGWDYVPSGPDALALPQLLVKGFA